MSDEGICGFGDCIAQMIGFALIGAVVGMGGAYLLGRHNKAKEQAALPEAMPDMDPAYQGLSGGKRRRHPKRRRALSGCGCGG